jgi:thioredoxin-related protein
MIYRLNLQNLWAALSLVIIMAGAVNPAYTQNKVQWMKFEDAVTASQKEPRKIFVDIYADWCGWCKVLDKDTFSDTGVIRILNKHYYPVKLDSESKEIHTVGDNKMSSPELAASLAMVKANEGLGLPTMVIINERMQLEEVIQGFRKPDFMKEKLSFFAFGANAALSSQKARVKWMKFEDAVTASQEEPRKIFVDIYADWCGWCKVLDRDTFSDTAVARILNGSYYPVKLDAESQETHTLPDGRKVSSAELAASLAASKPGEKYGLPSMIILNEKAAILTRIQGAQKPDFMTPALLFFSENHYLEKSWEAYAKEYFDKIKRLNTTSK